MVGQAGGQSLCQPTRDLETEMSQGGVSHGSGGNGWALYHHLAQSQSGVPWMKKDLSLQAEEDPINKQLEAVS